MRNKAKVPSGEYEDQQANADSNRQWNILAGNDAGMHQ